MKRTRTLVYLKWMAMNSFSSSVSSVISTNSMLSSIMTTPSYTSVIATNYVGKDIIGQLGGLTYAWKTGKNADHQPLKYITKGSLIQQTSFFLENAAPLISNKFLILPFLGFSSTLKNISFISIGAVNATNLRKLSSGRIGEFYSKAAAINTIASTLGMIVGIATIHFIPSYTIRSFIVLPMMSAISIYSLRRATRIVSPKELLRAEPCEPVAKQPILSNPDEHLYISKILVSPCFRHY
jgi:hypothetical protein